MKMEDLKEALLTLRNTTPDGADAYKALLIASAGIVNLMTARFLAKTRIQSAFDSDDGFAMKRALKKAKELVPWFEKCGSEALLAISIMQLKLIRK